MKQMDKWEGTEAAQEEFRPSLGAEGASDLLRALQVTALPVPSLLFPVSQKTPLSDP